jgi:hypothetical protein
VKASPTGVVGGPKGESRFGCRPGPGENPFTDLGGVRGTVVTSAAELTGALASGAKSIEVRGEIGGMPMITVGPG